MTLYAIVSRQQKPLAWNKGHRGFILMFLCTDLNFGPMSVIFYGYKSNIWAFCAKCENVPLKSHALAFQLHCYTACATVYICPAPNPTLLLGFQSSAASPDPLHCHLDVQIAQTGSYPPGTPAHFFFFFHFFFKPQHVEGKRRIDISTLHSNFTTGIIPEGITSWNPRDQDIKAAAAHPKVQH